MSIPMIGSSTYSPLMMLLVREASAARKQNPEQHGRRPVVRVTLPTAEELHAPQEVDPERWDGLA